MPAIQAVCKLADCFCYTAIPGKPEECMCSHPDKPHYMRVPCPLYRKNWTQGGDAPELKARLKDMRKKFGA